MISYTLLCHHLTKLLRLQCPWEIYVDRCACDAIWISQQIFNVVVKFSKAGNLYSVSLYCILQDFVHYADELLHVATFFIVEIKNMHNIRMAGPITHRCFFLNVVTTVNPKLLVQKDFCFIEIVIDLLCFIAKLKELICHKLHSAYWSILLKRKV